MREYQADADGMQARATDAVLLLTAGIVTNEAGESVPTQAGWDRIKATLVLCRPEMAVLVVGGSAMMAPVRRRCTPGS